MRIFCFRFKFWANVTLFCYMQAKNDIFFLFLWKSLQRSFLKCLYLRILIEKVLISNVLNNLK